MPSLVEILSGSITKLNKTISSIYNPEFWVMNRISSNSFVANLSLKGFNMLINKPYILNVTLYEIPKQPKIVDTSTLERFFDPELYEVFQEQEWVPVMVELYDDSRIDIDPKLSKSEKEKLYDIQSHYFSKSEDIVLSDLSNNFKLDGKLATVNAFTGQINREGFEFLKNDPRVKAIYYSKPNSMRANLLQSVPLINNGVTPLSYTGQGQADLVIQNNDVLITQNSEYLEANVTIRNIGGTDANNFEVRFFMQSPPQFKTLSVKKASSNKTTFKWNLTDGNYMMQISADSSYIIYESNESNNFYYKNIIIPDYFPPPRPGLMAYPPVWASSVTRVVDISPPNTSDAIDHYEYMIDYGEYTNIGLNLSFVTPKKSNGEHILYVRAIDDDGNIGALGNVSLLIDTDAPFRPFVREWHMGNNWTQHDTPYLSWSNPGDRGSGVIKYEIFNETSAMFNTTNTSAHLPDMNTGIHKIGIKAYDAVLTKNVSNNITIYVDKTTPSSPIVSSPTHPNPLSTYNNSFPAFNWTTPSDHSGIRGYYYLFDRLNDTIPDTFSYWTFNNSINITGFSTFVSNETNSSSPIGLADGSWYFHIKSQDRAGNLGINITHFRINIG